MKLADEIFALLSDHLTTLMPSRSLRKQLDRLVEEDVRKKYHHTTDRDESLIKEHLLEAMMTLAFDKKQAPLRILLNYCFAEHQKQYMMSFFHCKDPIETQDTDKFTDFICDTLLMSHALCANNDRVAELLAQGGNENIAAFSYLMTGNMEEFRKLPTASTEIILLASWMWTSYKLATLPILIFLGTVIKGTNAVSHLPIMFKKALDFSDPRLIPTFPKMRGVLHHNAKVLSRSLGTALSYVAKQEAKKILAQITAEQAQMTAEHSKTNDLKNQKKSSDTVSITLNSMFAKQEEKGVPAHLFYAKGRNFKVL